MNNDGQISFVERSNLLSYKTIELLTINLNLMASSCILCNNDYFQLRGPTPFEDMIFYLWTDSNEICTAYVKLKIN